MLPSQMRVKDRTRLRGWIGMPVRVVKTSPVSAQAAPSLARSDSWAALRAVMATRASPISGRSRLPARVLTG